MYFDHTPPFSFQLLPDLSKMIPHTSMLSSSSFLNSPDSSYVVHMHRGGRPFTEGTGDLLVALPTRKK